MSDTHGECVRKFRMLDDIYREECARIRGVANISNAAPKRIGAKRKTSLLKRSGKRGRKSSSSPKCEASASTKKVSQPARTLPNFILSSENDEIISVLALISLSEGPPASGHSLPQSEGIEPETSVCLTNSNPADFSAEVAKTYMRSC